MPSRVDLLILRFDFSLCVHFLLLLYQPHTRRGLQLHTGSLCRVHTSAASVAPGQAPPGLPFRMRGALVLSSAASFLASLLPPPVPYKDLLMTLGHLDDPG